VLPLESLVKEAVERGRAESYASNPWTGALASELKAFLAKPHDEWEKRLRRVVEAARRVDGACSAGSVAFASSGDLREQGRARRELGALVEAALTVSSKDLLAQWLETDASKRQSDATESEDKHASGKETASETRVLN